MINKNESSNLTGYLVLFVALALAGASAFSVVSVSGLQKEVTKLEQSIDSLKADSSATKVEGLRKAMVNNDSVLGSHALTTRRLFLEYVSSPDSVRAKILRTSPQDSVKAQK